LKNGVLVEEESPTAYASVIEKVLSNDDLRCLMQKEALRTAYQDASVERMMDGFLQAIQFVVNGR